MAMVATRTAIIILCICLVVPTSPFTLKHTKVGSTHAPSAAILLSNACKSKSCSSRQVLFPFRLKASISHAVNTADEKKDTVTSPQARRIFGMHSGAPAGLDKEETFHRSEWFCKSVVNVCVRKLEFQVSTEPLEDLACSIMGTLSKHCSEFDIVSCQGFLKIELPQQMFANSTYTYIYIICMRFANICLILCRAKDF
jgi:hypothetical protein